MAVYKIPQDVEADDKLFGPLSFKQFVFIGIALLCLYLSVYLGFIKGFWLILIFTVPIIVVTGFLGFPWGRDQPTEVWLAAKIRFMIKPRKRIWNQTGLKELVTITAPKRIERMLTNNLSQEEVVSRLGALSSVLDSRGWAIKNPSVNLYGNPTTTFDVGERLINTAVLPQEDQISDVGEADDIMESASAHHIDELISKSTAGQRNAVIQQMESARADRVGQRPVEHQPEPQDFWFMNKSGDKDKNLPEGFTTFADPSIVKPKSQPLDQSEVLTEEEQEVLEHARTEHEKEKKSRPYGNMKIIDPKGKPVKKKHEAGRSEKANAKPVTTPVDPAILNLASRNDVNVATAKHLADEITKNKDNGEVVISFRH